MLPPGSPTGVWLPVQSRHAMGGRYVLLAHYTDRDAGGQRARSGYLWYRGARLQDLLFT